MGIEKLPGVPKFPNFKNLYERHQRWIPIVFFGFGFLFDALMLRRIDELRTLIQQALYIVISAALISVEIMERLNAEPPPGPEVRVPRRIPRLIQKAWKYREAFLHFLLGTLLNSYTIFYLKSASTLTSFSFIVILIVLLSLNEFKHFGKSQTQVHMAFWSLCVVSYFASLAPIVLGFMGSIPFLSAMLASLLGFWIFFWLLGRLLLKSRASEAERSRVLRTHVFAPFAGILLLFTALYFAHAIPPVPLSVKYMGIFHGVTKGNGEYTLSYTRPSWKFWQHGDQTFLARPGDSIYCFVKVFSPSRFNDKLQVRWLYWNARHGWMSSDAIPMPIEGGREEGFRGVTQKSHFQPGSWRVQIETLDNREVGRIGFTVEADEGAGERAVKTLVQ
jgi:hypothetical protein